MKNANSILSHLSSLPQFRLLKPQVCYQKYIKLLKPHWQKGVAFVYIKEEVLFIAVIHPAFKAELNCNKDLLIDFLKMLNRHDLECKKILAKKVVIFHSKYHAISEDKEEETRPYYQEQAQGNFEMPKDEALQECFKRMKEKIQIQ